jgi:hypothetical protein
MRLGGNVSAGVDSSVDLDVCSNRLRATNDPHPTREGRVRRITRMRSILLAIEA